MANAAIVRGRPLLAPPTPRLMRIAEPAAMVLLTIVRVRQHPASPSKIEPALHAKRTTESLPRAVGSLSKTSAPAFGVGVDEAVCDGHAQRRRRACPAGADRPKNLRCSATLAQKIGVARRSRDRVVDDRIDLMLRWRRSDITLHYMMSEARCGSSDSKFRIQVVLRPYGADLQRAHHRRRRSERLRQVQHRRRHPLVHGRAVRQAPARQGDGRRHLRRLRLARAARHVRGHADLRERRPRAARVPRLLRDRGHAQALPRRHQRVLPQQDARAACATSPTSSSAPASAPRPTRSSSRAASA